MTSISAGEKRYSENFKRLLEAEATTRLDISRLLDDVNLTGSDDISFTQATKQYNGEVSSNHSLKASSTSVNPSKVCSKSLNNSKWHTPSRAPAIKRLVTLAELLSGLEALRPIVYPIIKVASIPKNFGNHRISTFQDHIEYYLEVLVQAARAFPLITSRLSHRAFVILWVLPLIELDNKNFIRRALDVVGLLARTGNSSDIQRARLMLTIIPFDKEDEDMVNAFFKVAGDFRSARNFQDALNIYEQFLHLPSSPYFREACLWSAFCKASAEPPQFGAAQLFLNQFLATYKADGGTPQGMILSIPFGDSSKPCCFKDLSKPLKMRWTKLVAVVFPVSATVGCRNPSPLCNAIKKRVNLIPPRMFTVNSRFFFPKHPKTRQFELDFPDLTKN